MGRADENKANQAIASAEIPCWQEILYDALGGVHTWNQQLEHFFDHLERAQ